MTEVLHIPPGVIMPKDLITWLRDQRDATLQIAQDYADQGDWGEAEREQAAASSYNHVLQHVMYGSGL